MTVITGDCVEVMAAMDPDSVDAIVCDPPYGIGFMGKSWDSFDVDPVEASWSAKGRNTRTDKSAFKEGVGTSGTSFRPTNPRCGDCGRVTIGRDTPKGFKVCHCESPRIVGTPNRDAQRSQQWHEQWATEALRVARPGAYLLAFGGTRTVHRMTCAIEDAGWIIRDVLVWAYAQGFPKSKSSLKPAWEPIVLARKPGPLQPLQIDAARIGTTKDIPASPSQMEDTRTHGKFGPTPTDTEGWNAESGRWPANVVLTDEHDVGGIFDGGWDGVVGGGETGISNGGGMRGGGIFGGGGTPPGVVDVGYGDTGTYSRFFCLPKASRSDREPVMPGMLDGTVVSVWGGDEDDLTPGKKSTVARRNVHPTVKPLELMRHLVRLVTPPGGTVLDPFAGSGSTLLAADQEGFDWVGIEREAEYVDIINARLAGNQRGMGLSA